MPRPPRRRARPPRAAAARAAVSGLLAAAAFALATAGPLTAAGASPAAPLTSNASQAAGAATHAADVLPVTLAITAITPGYLTAAKAVTVSGTVTNISGAALTGLTVQLRSSGTPISSREGLQIYADSATVADTPVTGATTPISSSLAPRQKATWSIKLRPKQLGLAGFGVYPLAAEVDSAAGNGLVAERTFLPYWPGKHSLDPKRQDIAWVWPLIGRPEQSVCPGGLLTNGLAGSFGPSGRLAGLLTAGRTYASSAHLTWAIEPSLLASAKVMTHAYTYGGTTACGNGHSRPASKTAAAWLAGVQSVTASQPSFLTPYADVDAAALIHQGLNTDLSLAFTAGRSTARQVLGLGSGQGSLLDTGLAWPAEGIANYSVLNGMAISDINTVILNSNTMPPSPSQGFTPSAVSSTPSGVGPRMHVLIADQTITQVLDTANQGGTSAGTTFAVAQRFLAETAMAAAEEPGVARSLVIAPPRSWNPPAGLASQLLASTVSAPWLRPVSLPALASAPRAAGQVHRKLHQVTSKNELHAGLLRGVRQLDASAGLLESIRSAPDPQLSAAILGVESAAWRGGGVHARKARVLLHRISSYVAGQQSAILVIGPQRVTLGGLSGTLPVSISNQLDYAITVRLGVELTSQQRIQVKLPPGTITVPANTDKTIKLHVRASAVGSTTIRLNLLSRSGTPLPGHSVTLTVQATHFGTLAIVIIGAALCVFMLASIRRAFTRGRGEQPPPLTDPEGGGPASPEPPGQAERADNVVADQADDEPPAEDPDEYASTPGRTDGG
jgi:hypothetical protein